jgi:hypothetical protein
MKWITSYQDEFQPHRWFAWFPVRVEQRLINGAYVSRWVWLDYVWRRRDMGYMDAWWTYWTETGGSRADSF